MVRVYRIESLSIEIFRMQTGIPGSFCFTYLSTGTLILSAFLMLNFIMDLSSISICILDNVQENLPTYDQQKNNYKRWKYPFHMQT